ncbi:hypothetical protein diail_7504 [Diaporthe ilicicola]|nr:hypothetical protein diail_7504 [Diaporthe ilicicola]
MTGTSSIGPISVKGAGDQRNAKNSELEHDERYEEGKVNSHQNDDPKSNILTMPQRISDPLPTAWPLRRRRTKSPRTTKRP